jgi:hypothetical protein
MNEADAQLLLDLLKDDRLEEVVEYLVRSFPNEENIIQLSGGLQKIRSLTFKGELSNDEIIRHRNITRNNTINIIKALEKSKFEKKIPTKTYPHTPLDIYLFPVVVVGFIIFLLFTLFKECNLPKPVAFPPISETEQPQKPTKSNIVQQTATPYLEEKKVIGFDREGRKAEYIIFIVRNFNWVLGETYISERNGEQSEICEHLSTIGVEARLNREDFKGIICFGNTSVEEDLSLPKSIRKSNEEDRAEFRATFLSFCVSQVLKNRTPIFKANLGKYNLRDEITDYQREIIIVGIVQNDEKVINEEALFNGLIDWHLLEGWEIDIREYSKVKQEKVPIERYLN